MDLQTERPIIPLQIDPPDHRKYRKLLDPLFAPQKMAVLESSFSTLVNDLMDGFSGSSEIDFSTQFSIPYPSQVFLTLLGLPLDDLSQFLQWKDGIMRTEVVVGKPGTHPDTLAYRKASGDSIYAYFEDHLRERAGDRREGLISHLLEAEVEGDRLTHEEVLDICFTLFNAGLDTVSASLDCFFAYLADHSDARRQIVDRPESIPRAVEELMRWSSPVMLIVRGSTQDQVIGDVDVPSGELVFLLLGAANVDGDEVPDPFTVDLDRDPNRHLAFGGGIHRCLGSHLARLELRVALREWHRRIPEYSIRPGVELQYSPIVRSIDHFPMLITWV